MILKMQETEEAVIGLMTPPSQSNAAIWEQSLRAAFHIGETAYIEKHKGTVLHYGTDFERFDLLWELAKLYKDMNLTESFGVIPFILQKHDKQNRNLEDANRIMPLQERAAAEKVRFSPCCWDIIRITAEAFYMTGLN